MRARKLGIAVAASLAALAASMLPATSAQAYSPTPGTMYQLPGDQPCLKGRGNCAIYPKAAQLPSGRLVAAFELATVPASGSAAGETLPVYKSDDGGTSWQLLSQVKAPAYLSSDPRYAKYTSAWTNPYLYVLPQSVGNLRAGTLLLAAVVSGDDHYYLEHKAADPNWVPNNDGDRADLAIALYASTSQGADWRFVNIITTGGWQGGSAGAIGANLSAANTYREVDPVWEPYLLAYDGRLVAYYSDENDYLGYNSNTGAPTIDPANATATDSHGQILAHRTWNGSSAAWSSAVVDVPGTTVAMGGGKSQIGGGRPGMANVVQTSDGKWLLTFEFWGGGDNVRYKIARDPLHFYSVGGADGAGISTLSVTAGSRGLSQGGSPVLVRLSGGRLAFNAAGSADVWVNPTGSSTGAWTEYQTTVPAGYSRNLTFDPRTGQVLIVGNQGVSTIIYATVDLGHSAGMYYQIVNKLTGQVIGTHGNTTDANLGNANAPDVELESVDSAANPDTQQWHVVAKADGNVMLLNKSGGRAAEIWTGNATAGQQIGQWVDNTSTGLWKVISLAGGYVEFQSVGNPNLYLTGASTDAHLTLQPATTDGSQQWQLK